MKIAFAVALLIAAASSTAQSAPQTSKGFARPVAAPADPAHHLLVGNSFARAYRVDVAPHETTREQRHDHDYLVVSLGQNQLKMLTGGTEYRMDLEGGEMQVIKGGWPHRVANESANAMHIIEVEVRRGIEPEHAICGLGGKSCTDSAFGKSKAGAYLRTTMCETPTVKVERVELDSGMSVPDYRTSGPTLIVALADVDTGALQLKSGEAGWTGARSNLTNAGSQPAQFLIVEFKE